MGPEALFNSFRQRLLGRPVSYRRLAGNSLLVYFDGTPGSKSGLTLWFEPTWHLRGPNRVLTGSREAQHDADAPDPDAGFRRAAEAVDVLVGRELRELTVEEITGDLVAAFDGDVVLRTFVSDPTTEELWHIRDCAVGRRLQRTGSEFKIIESDA